MNALCPVAGKPGKHVPLVTVRSLVLEKRAPEVEGRDWFLCSLRDCDVVYFTREGKTLNKEALKVRIGLKEQTAPRPVCYCFGHTIESIREEIERTGESSVVASITGKVRAGECSCEILNPKGTCCLGDVDMAVKAGFASAVVAISTPSSTTGTREEKEHACCIALPRSSILGDEARDPSPGQAGSQSRGPDMAMRPQKTQSKEGLTLVGSVVAALAASTCCTAPVIFALLGMGGAAFGVVLEPYRPVFIGITLTLLAGAFYFVYRRSTASGCSPSGTCAVPPRRTRLKVLLWVVTAIDLAALTIPYYIKYFL